MSNVIDFTAKKGRKISNDWQAEQAKIASNLPAEDTPEHYIKYLRTLDSGESGLLSDAADCIEELLGNLYEAENELAESKDIIDELRSELTELEIALGELQSPARQQELGC